MISNGSNIFPLRPLMSDDERMLFIQQLRISKRYFEFGSGGSSVWAIAHGLNVFGVESDLSWVNALSMQLGSGFQVKHVDVGPTGDWGTPIDIAHVNSFPAYSSAIHEFEEAFDLILIDGRFRVASLFAAIIQTARCGAQDRTTIFFHDFWNRIEYHIVLDFLNLLEAVNTTGLFKVKKNCDSTALNNLYEKYSRDPA